METFRFVSADFDAPSGVASLRYAFDDGATFEERIRFPYQPWPSDPSRQAAFERALSLLHLVAGVSYWKACVPPAMDTGAQPLDRRCAEFLQRLYVEGLAEFAWHNQLELSDRVSFTADSDALPAPLMLDLPDRVLLPVGGGKDSLVSLELLRDAGVEVQPVCVGASTLISDTVKVAGLPLIRIDRELSPQLAAMNAAGALNGHVPVTAINSAILLCAAILYGHRWVVFSNEHSASEPTLVDARGRGVNHQWSKSLAFEQLFRERIEAQVSPDIGYFSLLRPYNELTIASRFARHGAYHRVFSSCNRNFHLDGRRIDGRWCGNCPKCRFTFLSLAPFMSAQDLREIFGGNLLDDRSQLDGFRALGRLGVDKPFECVGTAEESRAALCHLAGLAEWREASVLAALGPALDCGEEQSLRRMLDTRYPHAVPGRFKDALV